MSVPPNATVPLREERQLYALFENSEKPEAAWRIGVECERFGVERSSGAPLRYERPFGVLRIFDWLIQERGYAPECELDGGPTIAVNKAGLSLTLEPGAQFELSAPAVHSVHEVTAALSDHVEELGPITRELNLCWLWLGFQPFAKQSELSWVPKQRYRIMREYLPKHGSGSLDMMRRTATVQGNFDYSDQKDALRKLRLGLRLAPIVNAWAANSPYVEGRFSGKLSTRGDVWLRMQPERSGLLEQLWDRPEAGYRDYIEWALDAPMFLIKRKGRIIDNSGQPFRDFMARGFQGEQATEQDWQLHVNSLFPEVRLKSTLEFRSVDSSEPSLATSVVALLTGILYDASALADAEALLGRLSFAEASAARSDLVTRGLAANYGPYRGFDLARELFAIAKGGLQRRGRALAGADESQWLSGLEALVAEETSPAALLLARFGEVPDKEQLLAAFAPPRPALP